jgi:sterol desaturase/sphingolipid hydroxylase (fatty acid hydroxylase superfamily)
LDYAVEPGSSVTVAVALAVGLSLFLLERVLPLRRAVRPLVGRVAVNLAVSALAFGVALAVVRPAVQAAFGWSQDRPFGLLHLVALPPALQAVAAFLLMDLTFYYWHLLNHKVPFLWRFHNVHHFDPDLDVSTAFRFHFGEIALSAGLRGVQVLVLGLPGWVYAVYELAFHANTLFHHSNVRLPIRVERALNRVLVTPRMHGIHHSQVQREANSNYGVVLPWWDRLHRTLGLNVPQSAVVIGVPGYSEPDDNRLWSMTASPFRKQRDYWRTLDGSPVSRDPEVDGRDPHRLAE